MLGVRFSRLVHAAIASGALVLAGCQGGGKGDSDTDGETTTTTGEPADPTGGPTINPTLDPTLGPVPPAPPDPPDPPDPPPPPADTPPALLSVTLLDPSTLQLSFSEPIAPTDAVNPKRFRLSFVRAYAGNYGGEPSTMLADPRFYNGAYCPPPPPCYYEPPYYDCYYEPYCYYYEPSAPIVGTAVINHDSDPNALLIPLSAAILPALCQSLEAISADPNLEAVLHLHYADGGQAQVTDLAGLPLPALAEEWVKLGGEYFIYEGQFLTNFDPLVPIPCPFF